jgi:hypothetical protein
MGGDHGEETESQKFMNFAGCSSCSEGKRESEWSLLHGSAKRDRAGNDEKDENRQQRINHQRSGLIVAEVTDAPPFHDVAEVLP